MKTELVNRSVYANIIILMVTMAISGCIIFPVAEHTGVKPGAIQAGLTSKGTIFKNLGFQAMKTPDGRFFLYNYSKDTEWCYVVILPPAGFESCTSNLFSTQGRVLIEFDNDNIVKQHVAHTCMKPPDPLCDQPSTDTMLVMINQLIGEDVAAQYGQALEADRQAEALQLEADRQAEALQLEADRQAVKRLIDEGADLNARDTRGDMPLHRAIRNSDTKVVQLLLTHGADANALYWGSPLYFLRPVRWARDLGGREDIIELLKQHGGKE